MVVALSTAAAVDALRVVRAPSCKLCSCIYVYNVNYMRYIYLYIMFHPPIDIKTMLLLHAKESLVDYSL